MTRTKSGGDNAGGFAYALCKQTGKGGGATGPPRAEKKKVQHADKEGKRGIGAVYEIAHKKIGLWPPVSSLFFFFVASSVRFGARLF